MPEVTAAQWDDFLADHPEAHLLQSAAWGELKAAFGWRARRVVAGSNGAQVLIRPIQFGFSFAYVPKGPVGLNWEGLWGELDALCRQERAVFLKVEPDNWENEERAGQTESTLRLNGFKPSPHTIQPARTLVVDLQGDESELLSRMKQKTRYNIRLAQKKEVEVSASADVDCFYELMQMTGDRDAFGVHSRQYYQRAYELFAPDEKGQLFLAKYAGEALGGLMVFRRGKRAWYFYGASSEQERSRMPAYLLQWEAMRWARSHGCTEYDLWGVPDADEQSLESQFEHRSDGLWGVYRFKRGFGGRLMRAASAWDRVYNAPLYAMYRWAAKKKTEE